MSQDVQPLGIGTAALGCGMLLLMIVVGIGGVVLFFIHPLLTLLAAILIAIIWHGFRVSRN